jgi:hypothetical protein
MPSNETLAQLIAMSHTLDEPENDYAMLGEGNSSAQASDETF